MTALALNAPLGDLGTLFVIRSRYTVNLETRLRGSELWQGSGRQQQKRDRQHWQINQTDEGEIQIFDWDSIGFWSDSIRGVINRVRLDGQGPSVPSQWQTNFNLLTANAVGGRGERGSEGDNSEKIKSEGVGKWIYADTYTGGNKCCFEETGKAGKQGESWLDQGCCRRQFSCRL